MSTTTLSPRTSDCHSRAAEAVAAYIRAKDGNRPHLLRAAFTDTAQLTMRVRTPGISFPPGALGRAAIAEMLVTNFNQTWENVYTLCIGAPPRHDATSFSCDWLVAMSAKHDGSVRAGCGRYDWTFDPASGRARSLVITIDAMETLACSVDSVADWVSALPGPWCDARRLAADAPSSPALRAVLARLCPSP
jgi:hypothetical protein